MMEPVIEIRNVKKKYRRGEIGGQTLQNEIKSWWAKKRGKEDPNTKIGDVYLKNETFYALDGIDLTVYPGERIGIIGRNGAGKSTLLKLICRITEPTDGIIDLYGTVTSMLEVGTGFNGELTGRENIYLNGAILGMTKREIDRKIGDIVAFSEIEDFIDTPVKRYSSGMYVKLAFAVAAHLDSDIIIMDEVLAVGDMAFQKKCLKKMRKAATEEGRAVLYVSHNMNTIRSLCSRCIVLDEGKIIYDGEVDHAISLYLGTEDAKQTLFTFNQDYRPYDESLRANKRLELLTLKVENRDGAVFHPSDKELLTVELEAFMPFERVGFRLEFWYQDGTKVGSMLSSTFVALEKGKNTVQIEMDPAHLTGGQYSADLVVYQFDEDGTEDILDGVYPGVIFQIEDQLHVDTHLDWHHQYWGHIHLHDIGVIRK